MTKLLLTWARQSLWTNWSGAEVAQGQTSSCEAALKANGRTGEDGFSSLAAATGTEINFKHLPCLSNL